MGFGRESCRPRVLTRRSWQVCKRSLGTNTSQNRLEKGREAGRVDGAPVAEDSPSGPKFKAVHYGLCVVLAITLRVVLIDNAMASMAKAIPASGLPSLSKVGDILGTGRRSLLFDN